jgi:hypothetical protein
MRYYLLAAGLLAAATTAQAQTSPWNFAQNDAAGGSLIAFVEGTGGNQLVFKCDKPGKRSVYAMFSGDLKLGKPGPIPSQRTTAYRFDNGPTKKDEWRYYEKIAVALHTARDRALIKLIENFDTAKEVELRLDPLEDAPFTSTFDISGAPEALARVYESCKDDTSPLK